jgi:peptide/nickel transport system permease protein
MLKHIILPVTVGTLVSYAGTMLMMRNTMLETLKEDYVMAARAKGLSEAAVRDHHAARNAFLPVFTNLIISIPFVLSGGIITETVFSWPGMGLTLLQAVQNEDLPLAMGALTFVGVLALFAHLVADVAYAFLDPRIRY